MYDSSGWELIMTGVKVRNQKIMYQYKAGQDDVCKSLGECQRLAVSFQTNLSSLMLDWIVSLNSPAMTLMEKGRN